MLQNIHLYNENLYSTTSNIHTHDLSEVKSIIITNNDKVCFEIAANSNELVVNSGFIQRIYDFLLTNQILICSLSVIIISITLICLNVNFYYLLIKILVLLVKVQYAFFKLAFADPSKFTATNIRVLMDLQYECEKFVKILTSITNPDLQRIISLLIDHLNTIIDIITRFIG